mgnify:FL=1
MSHSQKEKPALLTRAESGKPSDDTTKLPDQVSGVNAPSWKSFIWLARTEHRRMLARTAARIWRAR